VTAGALEVLAVPLAFVTRQRYSVSVNQVMMVLVKFRRMTSIKSIGSLDSVASLVTATLYQGHHDRNHKQCVIHFRQLC